VLLRDVLYPPITVEQFLALRQKQPKRVCFGSTHKNALKANSNGKGAGFFNVPFAETISGIFPWDIFPNKKGQFGGYFRGVSDDAEFAEIGAWLERHADVVFIRSLFATAIATCEHYGVGNSRSAIGELEKCAKFDGDINAKTQLVAILKRAFDRLHHSRGISALVSVPASVNGRQSLPNHLASRLSAELGLPDLTASLRWDGPKGQIKELGVQEKWAALEKVGLSVDGTVAGKNLLLIDDMYQSGATAHFVASRLRAVGANDLHLLVVSKGKRDTDNK
jgi:predicted amidophosphoribosyltransferase